MDRLFGRLGFPRLLLPSALENLYPLVVTKFSRRELMKTSLAFSYGWLYTQSFLNKYGKSAYQNRLIGLWVLAKRLSMPQPQSNAIDALEERRGLEDCLQIKSLQFADQNTQAGDDLRLYVVDTCLPVMTPLRPRQ